MSWQEIYKSRMMSAQDAAKIIKSGDRFWTPLCLGQPAMLIMDLIADRVDELQDVEYLNALTLHSIGQQGESLLHLVLHLHLRRVGIRARSKGEDNFRTAG